MSALAIPISVYDVDGALFRSVDAGGPPGKVTESPTVWPTRAAAMAHTYWLGADRVEGEP